MFVFAGHLPVEDLNDGHLLRADAEEGVKQAAVAVFVLPLCWCIHCSAFWKSINPRRQKPEPCHRPRRCHCVLSDVGFRWCLF